MGLVYVTEPDLRADMITTIVDNQEDEIHAYVFKKAMMDAMSENVVIRERIILEDSSLVGRFISSVTQQLPNSFFKVYLFSGGAIAPRRREGI